MVFGFVFTPKSFLIYLQQTHVPLEFQLNHTVLNQGGRKIILGVNQVLLGFQDISNLSSDVTSGQE